MSRIGLSLALEVLKAVETQAEQGKALDGGMLSALLSGLAPLVDREPSDAELSALNTMRDHLFPEKETFPSDKGDAPADPAAAAQTETGEGEHDPATDKTTEGPVPEEA